MVIRSEALLRGLFGAAFMYIFSVGGTFPGMSAPNLVAITLPMLTAAVIGWLLVRWRAGWRWHRTSFDLLLVGWAGAIAVSLLANLPDARRILIGVWFTLLYVAWWYMLTDILANIENRRADSASVPRFDARLALIDSLLIGATFALALSYWQLWQTRDRFGDGLFNLLRLPGTLGNPNLLATLAVVCVALSAGRWLSVRQRIWRVVLALYFLASLMMLLLTASRGGWVAGAAGLAAVAGFWLAERGLLSTVRLRAWFVGQSRAVRRGLLGVVLAGGVLLAAMTVAIVLSFNQPGRSLTLRTYIWDTALTMFAEKPLTGHGLFTFHKGIIRLNSTPPLTPHIHAHNLPLHIMAELGLPGLAVTLASVALILWLVRRNWRELRASNAPGEVIGFSTALAALIGFAVHHLVDVTVMMAGFALLAMLLLAVVCAPMRPIPLEAAWRRIGHPIAIIGLWAALLVTGWWSHGVTQQYVAIVSDGLARGDLLGAARGMDAILAVEPGISSYHWQQAMLYGAAAETLDGEDADAAAEAALRAFDQVIALEPQIAGGWANRAGLLWEAGQIDAALSDWRAAAEAAPDSWPFWLAYGRMSEQAGRADLAADGYARLNAALGDEDRVGATLHPVLADSPIYSALDAPPTTGLAEIARLWLRDGDPATASAAWEAAPASVTDSVAGWSVRALLAAEMGDADGASEWRERAAIDGEEGWLAYLDARLNGGDPAGALVPPPGNLTRPDLSSRINWWHGAFMRETTRRSFLRAARYEWLDPLLVAMLGASPNID